MILVFLRAQSFIFKIAYYKGSPIIVSDQTYLEKLLWDTNVIMCSNTAFN